MIDDPPVDELTDEFPLRLTTGRRLDSFNTGVPTGAFTSPLRRGETIDVSPEDAERLASPRRMRRRLEPPGVGRGTGPRRRGAPPRAVFDVPLPRPGRWACCDRGDRPEVGDRRVQGCRGAHRQVAGVAARRFGVRRRREQHPDRDRHPPASVALGGVVDLKLMQAARRPPSAPPWTSCSVRRRAPGAVRSNARNSTTVWPRGSRRARRPRPAAARAARPAGRGRLDQPRRYELRLRAPHGAPGRGVRVRRSTRCSASRNGPTVVHVCDDLACRRAGAETVIDRLRSDDATVVASPCLGLCERAPALLLQRAGDQGDSTLAPVTDDALEG